MTVRNVKKNLAAQQDLLPGVGPYQQVRRGVVVDVDGPAKSYIELWKDYCGKAYVGTFEDGFVTKPDCVAVSLALGKAYRYAATVEVSIPANSPVDLNWVELSTSVHGVQVLEALRRSYAEAGYNVVGTFQAGFTIVNANDVGIDLATGKGYTGPAGDVTAGTNPTSGGFVDVSNRILSIPYSGYYDNIAAALSDPRNIDTEVLLQKGSIAGGLIAKDCDLKGFGYSTIISEGPDGYAVKAMRSLPDWERRTISRLELKSTDNTGTQGIIYDPDDPLAGRWDTSYIGIEGFEIGIYKPQGNIGNTHRAVNFRNMSYGFKAKDGTLSTMHSGCERFEDCTWGGITTWCIDIECRTDGGGQIVIGDSIMEKCVGGGVRLDMGGKTSYLPVLIKNLWFEGIATAASVTRDGVPETPRQIKLIDTPIAFAEDCYLFNVELINSKMIATRCRVDDISTSNYNMVIDANSSLTLVDVFANGPIGPNPLVKSVSSQKWPCGNRNLSLRGEPPKQRQANAAGGVVKAKETYSGTVGSSTWSFPGTVSAVASCVADGIISANCAELSINAGNTQQSLLQADIVNGKWYVWGVNAKLVSGSGVFNFTDTASLGAIYTEQGKWVSTFGIGKAEVTGKARLFMIATTATVIRLQDYFVVEFDKEADALAFCNARVSIS